jgi:hypothetical protein
MPGDPAGTGSETRSVAPIPSAASTAARPSRSSNVIEERVIVRQVEMPDELRVRARTLVPRVSQELVARLGGGRVRNLNERGDYVGQYVTLADPGLGEALTLWVYVSVAGGRYNAPGAGDSLWVAEYVPDEMPSKRIRMALGETGAMELIRDRVGFMRYGTGWDLALDGEPGPVDVASRIGEVLRSVRNHVSGIEQP